MLYLCNGFPLHATLIDMYENFIMTLSSLSESLTFSELFHFGFGGGNQFELDESVQVQLFVLIRDRYLLAFVHQLVQLNRHHNQHIQNITRSIQELTLERPFSKTSSQKVSSKSVTSFSRMYFTFCLYKSGLSASKC